MTEDALRFWVDGRGTGTLLRPANQAALDAITGIGRYCYVELRDADPAHMDAHRFLFALLREMHANWPDNNFYTFKRWRNELKRAMGAGDFYEDKNGNERFEAEEWSPYKLSNKRLHEIIESVKQICYDVLKWDDAVINEAGK